MQTRGWRSPIPQIRKVSFVELEIYQSIRFLGQQQLFRKVIEASEIDSQVHAWCRAPW